MILVGNWKANGSFDLCDNFNTNLITARNIDIVICPPVVYCNYLIDKKVSDFSVGSQDCSEFEDGAYTGDITARMLAQIGIKYSIINHSERVHHYGDQNVLTKVQNCIEYEIEPIVCVDDEFIDSQSGTFILNSLRKMTEDIIIAYEPTSAIGTGLVPSNDEIADRFEKIKNIGPFRTLYGGSVNESNINILKTIPGTSGFLVGGASLNVEKFNKIVKTLDS